MFWSNNGVSSAMTSRHDDVTPAKAIPFPHDEALAGRDARTSAVHAALVEQGCVHQARHGFERPGWFAGAGMAPMFLFF